MYGLDPLRAIIQAYYSTVQLVENSKYISDIENDDISNAVMTFSRTYLGNHKWVDI